MADKKLYLTGGIGARAKGEAFGDDYELPNLTAYNETCAAVANIFWNERLFLLHGDAKYVDVLERTLYNGLLSGVSLDGTKFFYPNPLESDGSNQRSPWFGCACCPGNITRFLPSLPGYIYAQAGDTIYVNLYAGSTADFKLNERAGGQNHPGNPVSVERRGQNDSRSWTGRKARSSPSMSGSPAGRAMKSVPGGLYKFSNTVNEPVTLTVNDRNHTDQTRQGLCEPQPRVVVRRRD